jgi:hypothetical protein
MLRTKTEFALILVALLTFDKPVIHAGKSRGFLPPRKSVYGEEIERVNRSSDFHYYCLLLTKYTSTARTRVTTVIPA